MNGANMGGPVAAWHVPVVEVTVRGDLDAWSSGQVDQVLHEALRLRPRELVVDLAGCRAVDAAGVLLLLEAQRRVVHLGGRLALRSPGPQVARTLQEFDHERRLVLVPAAPRAPRHAADRR
ncbi:STAS domain-containing protein [Catellatospora sichuanensis]|uniref:STAS domain-containing protein n=1 Tax=Catellatospora sichuanensis TaxID=1969805 RepID=UPI001642C4ED|nr:STAS domain-containing protein [Catellatospora sichuanensis]